MWAHQRIQSTLWSNRLTLAAVDSGKPGGKDNSQKAIPVLGKEWGACIRQEEKEE